VRPPSHRRSTIFGDRWRCRPLAPSRALLLASVAAWVAACGASGIRPRYLPLPRAEVDTLAGQPDSVIDALAAAVVAEGLSVARASAVEGFLETRWFDLTLHRSVSGRTLHPNRLVRLRFFTDLVAPDRTQLVAEAATRVSVDPSLPEREAEMMAPPDHPGRALLDRVLARVKSGTKAAS
jgi:hypothetical protein